MKKIMIVNNDPDTMTLLQSLLQINGYIIQLNTRVDDLPGMLRDFKPGLVLLDISRQSVLDKVKNDAKTEKIPILLMTGHSSYAITKDEAIKDFIKKPFTMEELLKKIDGILQPHQST